jgi:hypothetical protein
MIDLILVLTLLALSESPAGDELPAQAAKSPVPASPPVQEGERPSLSAAELKLLKDTNIFAPRSAKRPRYTPSSKESKGRTETSTPPKPKAPVVTGIFFDAKADTFLVVVEDKNSESLKLFKEPKFLKAGDEVLGFKVTAVTADKATFVKGDVSKDLKVGEAMPGADGKPVTAAPGTEEPEATALEEGAEPKVEIKPQDPETNHKTLDEMRKKVGKKNRPSRDE